MLVFPRCTDVGCCDLCVAPAVGVCLIATVRASAMATSLTVNNNVKAHRDHLQLHGTRVTGHDGLLVL